MRDMLLEAAAQFRLYHTDHTRKAEAFRHKASNEADPGIKDSRLEDAAESERKASVNLDFAQRCENAANGEGLFVTAASGLLTEQQPYVGTKGVYARPMTRGEWCKSRGWTVPADENPDDAGKEVEYADGGASNIEGRAGYVSWSPADVFERAYQRLG